MSRNAEIAQLLEEISQLQTLMGADSFRASSNARAARAIADLGFDIETIADDPQALQEIDGVGKSVAKKIQDYFQTGRMQEREELLERVPAGLLEVLKIPGLGPKTVKAMWESLKIESIDDVRKAIEDESILNVPRMGQKTVENIKKAMAFAEAAGERTPLGIAATIGEILVERLSKVEGVTKVAQAGSVRRGKETIGDVDILVAPKDEAATTGIAEAFRGMPEVDEVLAAGATKSSVRASIETGSGKKKSIQCDLRIVPAESFGAALHYFTGSKEHNVRVRERAQKRGYTLNEYGLFPADDEEGPPQKRGVKPVASETEEEIFEALGLPYIPPELREDRGELSLEETPGLVTVESITCELHAHTTASDGSLTIEQLAQEAKRRGFHTIAVTDHSKSQAVANGLSVERLRAHIAAIREADEQIKGISILAGSEVDILASGALDYEDDALAELDVVVASPHMSLKQEPKKAQARLLKAIEHPLVHIVGHPTGRLIGRREGLTLDIAELSAAAAEHGCALEINSHWMRLDLRDTHVRAAMEAGALIAIDCDVHSAPDFDNLRFGVATARRGWATKERCVNTWSRKKLESWLKSKRTAPGGV